MAQIYHILPAAGSDQSDEWVRLGVEAHAANRLGEAQQKYQHALRLDPRHAIATQNLAVVFAQSGHLNEGLLTIERASMVDGVLWTIPMNHALMALESERIDEALEYARKAVEMAPKDIQGNSARMTLAMVLATAGMPADAIPLYNEILDTEPKHPIAAVNACFVQTLTNATPADLLRQRKRWYDANRYEGPKQPHNNDRRIDRPLRVGYVGGDFKQHSAAFIFSHVLLNHSSDIEMYLYSSLPVDPAADGRTKAFQCAVGYAPGPDHTAVPSGFGPHRWRDISAMNDEDADKLIRQDKIDILVDFAAHTNGGRLGLFTRKPAPVQVTAWGFAHGTGVPEIDYFFADRIAIPESERKYYAEKIIDLPCIVTINPPDDYNLKGTSKPPFKQNGYITFGSYARYEKMSDDCIRCFAEILRQVSDSKIQFKDNAYRRPYSIRRIMRLMPDSISPDRLLFSISTTHPDHLLAYQQADICLDPWPHGGGVVGLETLYMGVPLITLYGSQPSGRSAASVLSTIGKHEWIAKSPQEYIDKAVSLANDVNALTASRKTLRDELLNSKVYKGYIEAVESKYREIWQEWCKS